jgi:hypothetical protein
MRQGVMIGRDLIDFRSLFKFNQAKRVRLFLIRAFHDCRESEPPLQTHL